MGNDKIYGAIEENGDDMCMGSVFQAINNRQLNYNWMITNPDCAPDTIYDCWDREKECIWLSGERLTELVLVDDCAWIWGVFSGFDKDIPFSEIAKSSRPFANGYPGFWELPVSMQHPLAQVEIVMWDGWIKLCMSKDKDLVTDFAQFYLLSEDLETYNQKLLCD